MTRRRRLILGAAVVLLLLNVWRWWPALTGISRRSGGIAGELGIALEVPLPPAEAESVVLRDVFRFGQAAETPGAATRRRGDGPDATGARGGSERPVRLLAVILRSGRARALLSVGGTLHELAPGETLDDRFRVTAVTVDRVELRDSTTGVDMILSIADE